MSKFDHINTWIFDMDDTLYHPDCGIFEALKHNGRQYVADKLGISIEEADAHFQEFKAEGGTAFIGVREKLNLDLDDFCTITHGIDISHLTPCDISRQIIANLQGRKIVFTNAPDQHAERVLKQLDMTDLFDEVIHAQTTNFVSKPLRESYEIVLNRLGIQGDKCVLIEDSIRNLKGAKEWGMTTVLVHCPEHIPEDFIDYQYPTLLEFLQDVNR